MFAYTCFFLGVFRSSVCVQETRQGLRQPLAWRYYWATDSIPIYRGYMAYKHRWFSVSLRRTAMYVCTTWYLVYVIILRSCVCFLYLEQKSYKYTRQYLKLYVQKKRFLFRARSFHQNKRSTRITITAQYTDRSSRSIIPYLRWDKCARRSVQHGSTQQEKNMT